MCEIVPKWINSGLFEQLLRNYYESPSIHVISFELNHGFGVNQNFNSSVYRIKLTFAVS